MWNIIDRNGKLGEFSLDLKTLNLVLKSIDWRNGEKWSTVSTESGQRATGASRVDLGLDLRVECFG